MKLMSVMMFTKRISYRRRVGVSRLEGLHQYMTTRSHTGPARATQEALRQLQTIEKDLPVMKALSNRSLNDRHFRKVTFRNLQRRRGCD